MDRTPVLTAAELAEAARKSPPATSDDAPITQDGRRLQSRDDVLAFLAELDAERGDRRDVLSA